jgi:dTDP-4-dehydrorhamnose 3,5-epimerase
MMRSRPTKLPGVLAISFPVHADDRGRFSRLWCADSFREAGLDFAPIQASLSTNIARHTLRGLHWQAAPGAEAKLVRCLRGRMLDIAVDLRRGSETFGDHAAVELSPGNAEALFIPRGFAHGFLTLEPDTEILYLIDAPHDPALSRGMAWDDPDLALPWPAPPAVLSDRDAALPRLRDVLADGDVPC